MSEDLPTTSNNPPLDVDDGEMLWLVSYSEHDDREMTTRQIQAALGRGEITHQTIVWRDGLSEWRAIDQLPALAARVLGAAPGPKRRTVMGGFGLEPVRRPAPPPEEGTPTVPLAVTTGSQGEEESPVSTVEIDSDALESVASNAIPVPDLTPTLDLSDLGPTPVELMSDQEAVTPRNPLGPALADMERSAAEPDTDLEDAVGELEVEVEIPSLLVNDAPGKEVQPAPVQAMGEVAATHVDFDESAVETLTDDALESLPPDAILSMSPSELMGRVAAPVKESTPVVEVAQRSIFDVDLGPSAVAQTAECVTPAAPRPPQPSERAGESVLAPPLDVAPPSIDIFTAERAAFQPGPAPLQAAQMAPPEERSGGGGRAFLIVLLLGMVGGGAYYAGKMSGRVPVAETPPQLEAPPEQMAKVEESAASPIETAAVASAAASAEPAASSIPAAEAPIRKVSARAPRPSRRPTVQTPQVAAIRPVVKKPEPVKPKEEPVVEKAPFSTSAASGALKQAASRASSCRKPGDPSGIASVSVTFSPSGRATRAVLSGPPFAGTATGGCIAAKMRSARVPSFLGERKTVRKRVVIQ